MRTLLKMYGAVPASVRGGNGDAYNAHNAYAPYPGGSDTGMGFSYLRMIHVASALPLTARVGCFVLLVGVSDTGMNVVQICFRWEHDCLHVVVLPMLRSNRLI